MSARFQAVVVLGTCLLVRPTLGSAAHGVHLDAVSAQVYLDHTKPHQTYLFLQRKGKAGDSKGLAMRGLAVGAGFAALLEAPVIWDKLSSMFGWYTISHLELSDMLEGDPGPNDRHYHEEPWKIRSYFAMMCLCTFALGIMRRSFRHPTTASTASKTVDTCRPDTSVPTPRVERCPRKKKSVTLVSPRRESNASSGDEGTDEFVNTALPRTLPMTDDSCVDDDGSDLEEVQLHRICTPAESRASSKNSTSGVTSATFGWYARETESQFHRMDTPE